MDENFAADRHIFFYKLKNATTLKKVKIKNAV